MSSRGRVLSRGLITVLIAFSILHNYDLLFRQYQTQYQQSAWNTSEMGQVVQAFGQLVGTTDNAWLVGYPHWVDSRLVALNAGLEARDLAIWPEQFAETAEIAGSKMFMVNLQDSTALDQLRTVYPQGILVEYPSQVEKNFYLYFVLTDSISPAAAAALIAP